MLINYLERVYACIVLFLNLGTKSCCSDRLCNWGTFHWRCCSYDSIWRCRRYGGRRNRSQHWCLICRRFLQVSLLHEMDKTLFPQKVLILGRRFLCNQLFGKNGSQLESEFWKLIEEQTIELDRPSTVDSYWWNAKIYLLAIFAFKMNQSGPATKICDWTLGRWHVNKMLLLVWTLDIASWPVNKMSRAFAINVLWGSG